MTINRLYTVQENSTKSVTFQNDPTTPTYWRTVCIYRKKSAEKIFSAITYFFRKAGKFQQ